jgi:hypothetical protein
MFCDQLRSNASRSRESVMSAKSLVACFLGMLWRLIAFRLEDVSGLLIGHEQFRGSPDMFILPEALTSGCSNAM